MLVPAMKIKSTALFFLILPFNLALANKDEVPLGAKDPTLCATEAAMIFLERDISVHKVIKDIGGAPQKRNRGGLVSRELGFKILQLEEDYPGFPVRNIFKQTREDLYKLEAKTTAKFGTQTRKILEESQFSDEEIFESVRIQLQKDFLKIRDAFYFKLFTWLENAQWGNAKTTEYGFRLVEKSDLNKIRRTNLEFLEGTVGIYEVLGSFVFVYRQTVKSDELGEIKNEFRLSIKKDGLAEYQQIFSRAQNPRELREGLARLTPYNTVNHPDPFYDFLYLLREVRFYLPKN